MKFTALVLRNIRSGILSVDFAGVTDALLSGGVFLDEVVFLPYDDPVALTDALAARSSAEAIFVICSRVLAENVREGISLVTGKPFADGCVSETQSCLYALLTADMDGVNDVKKEVIPILDRRRGRSFLHVVIRTVGADGEAISAAVKRAECEGLLIHCTEKYGAARIEIVYDKTTPKYAVDEAMRILLSDLADYVYATEDVTVAERLVEALRIRRRTISVAESFTGGGIGRAIVRVPGASAVYFEGLNTYNGKSKMSRLGVTEFTVNYRGTVSEETAYEMAAGLIVDGNCDLSVATTGVAGPMSDEKGNPPGLVYIAIGSREEVQIYRYHLTGDREEITETAINLALFLAYKSLQ